MAEDDAAEPSLTGGFGTRMGGALRGGARKLLNAGRVGARVNVEGVRSATHEFDSLLQKLKQVRTELEAINKLQGATGAGTTPGGTGAAAGMSTGVGASGPSLSRFSAMTSGWSGMMLGGFGVTMAARGMSTLLGAPTDRFNRNLQESIPISQNNMAISSQYGAPYSGQEWARVKAMGNFNSSRSDTAAAQQIGLAYGQSYAQSNTFLSRTVAPLVQASGGTMSGSQAAASAGAFLDPSVMRRAQAMNIQQGRVGGQVQNPLTVAMSYVTDYNKRMGITMNAIDFENLRSPGSAVRYTFKRLYGLSDDAVDAVVQAGLQNAQFKSKTGVNIDFSSSANLNTIGLQQNRLGLKAFQYMTASVRREASFFGTQEGSMVGKLQQDTNIEDTLAKVEDAFSGILGPLGEFQRYLKLATTALGGIGTALMMGGLARGVLGGGGGGIGLPGLGGGGGGGGGGGVGGAGGVLGMGGSGMGTVLGGVALGAGVAWGGSKLGGAIGGRTGAAVGFGSSVAGGALIGGAIGSIVPGAGTFIGAGIGAAGGALVGASNFSARSAADVNSAMAAASGLTDAQLLAGIKNVTSHEGFGPKETARYDVWQQRRGALAAALISRVRDETGAFNGISNDTAAEIAKELEFFQSTSVTNDDKFNNKKDAFRKKVMPLISGNKDAMAIFSQIFGNTGVQDPFDWNHAVDTPESQSLIISSNDILGKADSTGDPEVGKGAKGDTWDKLDPKMQSRLNQMFTDSGGRVWLGNGWRSEQQQKTMFESRYTPDPSGDVTYQGKKWKRVRGAPAAPPGKSMHEIGLAADLEGDLSWVQENAAKYGLKTFAGVNGEPWHVQPAELPNSRADYEKGGGGSSSSSSSADASTLGDMGTAAAGGGASGWSGPSAISGVGFSLLNVSTSGGNSGGGGGVAASTASSTTSGSLGGASTTVGGQLTPEQIAKMAYTAGFRGAALTEIVSIAQRESSGLSTAKNESYANGTGNKKDMSYGLTQINLLPWLQKGETPPWTSAQLMDPQFNLNVAYSMYKSRGFQPWGIKGNPTANTNQGSAASAVAAAGYANSGDPMGGSSGVHIQTVQMSVTLQATGSLQYDASQFANVAVARLQESADLSARRSS